MALGGISTHVRHAHERPAAAAASVSAVSTAAATAAATPSASTPAVRGLRRYKFVSQIGDGTYGLVYMAVQTETRRRVAVKVMRRQYTDWDEVLRLREVRSLRKLNHPNVVKLKEVVRENARLYFVFEYLRGDLLGLMRARPEPLTEPAIRSIVFQMVQGIAYIHRLGFFHRDLKPENILTDGPDVVKIADFGLAREIRSSTADFTDYVSTRWYRAPEVLLRSKRYSAPIDIWAIGCIAAELYTKRPLFPGSSEIDQLHKIAAVLGTPTRADWAESASLARQMHFRFPQTPSTVHLSQFLSFRATTANVSFLYSLLKWNPSRRSTAPESLRHTYFRGPRRATVASSSSVAVAAAAASATSPHRSVVAAATAAALTTSTSITAPTSQVATPLHDRRGVSIAASGGGGVASDSRQRRHSIVATTTATTSLRQFRQPHLPRLTDDDDDNESDHEHEGESEGDDGGASVVADATPVTPTPPPGDNVTYVAQATPAMPTSLPEAETSPEKRSDATPAVEVDGVIGTTAGKEAHITPDACTDVTSKPSSLIMRYLLRRSQIASLRHTTPFAALTSSSTSPPPSTATMTSTSKPTFSRYVRRHAHHQQQPPPAAVSFLTSVPTYLMRRLQLTNAGLAVENHNTEPAASNESGAPVIGVDAAAKADNAISHISSNSDRRTTDWRAKYLS